MNGAGSDGAHIQPVAYPAIAPLREQYRHEAGCQIVRDSILRRGLASPYLLREGEKTVGYVGVWTEHFPGRLMEFCVRPEYRAESDVWFTRALSMADVTEAEAQSNIPLQHRMVMEHTTDHAVENLLFGEGASDLVARADLDVRRRRPTDDGPEGEYVVVSGGVVVGAGGILTHYNLPYADLYFEVAPDARGRGVGTFLVGELRRICRAQGLIPAARCDPDNEASRRTLVRGGLVAVGEIVVGQGRRGAQSPSLERPTGAL